MYLKNSQFSIEETFLIKSIQKVYISVDIWIYNLRILSLIYTKKYAKLNLVNSIYTSTFAEYTLIDINQQFIKESTSEIINYWRINKLSEIEQQLKNRQD